VNCGKNLPQFTPIKELSPTRFDATLKQTEEGMSAGKIIAYILAGIFIIIGALFILGSFAATGGGGNQLLVGAVIVAIGFGLIWFAGRRLATSPTQNVTLNIDLPGNVQMDSLKCKSCGGTLTAENIKMVAGAPVVTCPYCNSTYQLTEEPKW
jgi:hypothetical protein